MELVQLEYFVAAVEAGGISKGAARCGIAQPSMSQQIQRLEASLRVKLFDRVGRGVALTDAGRALLPRAKRLLAEAQALAPDVQSDVASGAVPLAIGAIPTMAPYLLPDVMRRLPREFPECELTIHEHYTDRVIARVLANELDFAIVSTPIEDDEIELEVIGKERLLVVAPVGTKLADRDVATIADLRDAPTIVLHEFHCLSGQVQGFCSTKRIARRIVCRSAQLPTLLEMVALGIGYSVVPEMAAQADRSKQRRYLPIGRGTPTREIALAWRRGRHRSRVACRAAELLAANIATGKYHLE